MRRLCAFVLILGGCSTEPAPDVCEQAAQHREACVGDYVTPPVCDEAGEAGAKLLLAMSCAQLIEAQNTSKADGAFCDWLGLGCTEDEPIFEGKSCKRDSECGAGGCFEKHCFAGVGSTEMNAMLDRWTDSRETGGSWSHLLVDNVETRELRKTMMDGARESIHFTALVIEDDEIGYETASELAAAARRGVEVRVIVDATTQYTFGSYKVFDEMRDAGVLILPYNPVLEWKWLRWKVDINANQRLHEKLLIVDGVEVVMGGRNVGEDYLTADHWRDTDVYLAGPGVADVQRMFLGIWDEFASWEKMAGCPQQASHGLYCPGQEVLSSDTRYTPSVEALGGARTRPIYSDPRSQKTPLGYLTMLSLVRSAKQSIEITNSYFVPPRRLRKHLKAAAARGVKVTVLTNSLGSTDAWWMYYASLNYYEELIKAGIVVRQYRGTETLHAKTALVDGKLAVVGSYNLDPRSAASNSESLVVIEDGDAVGELRDAFQVDIAYSDVASYKVSAADLIKAKAFRIAEPLL
jgi:cardiolipin synthase A/B